MLCMQELLSKLGGAGQLLASYTSLPPTPINFKSNSRYFHFCQKKEASNLRYSHQKSQRKWKKREIKKDTNPNVNSKIHFITIIYMKKIKYVWSTENEYIFHATRVQITNRAQALPEFCLSRLSVMRFSCKFSTSNNVISRAIWSK